ncbi:hypothetical protein C0995_013398 [Termitomyces sp. Mi166|nr:hypothetical protein C0995_013398 [Termitomyces sp. Mi166\
MLGPRSMGEVYQSSNPLQHHSTKQLISRYESMSSPYDQQVSGIPLESSMINPPAHSPKKEKSPMRQSFRNLFSVLKKVNLRKVKPVERPLSSYRKQHHPILSDHPGLDAPPVLRSRSRKLTSSLLYLSRTPQLLSDSSDPKPVWTSCTATLEPSTIVITGLTHSRNPSVHIIELLNCTDVRSLSPLQLDPEESALLPRKGENDEFKVFEILFEGRPREKFAANSVQERAGWVSAVWWVVPLSCMLYARTTGNRDTILSPKDQDSNQTSNAPKGPQSQENVGDLTSAPPTHDLRPKSFSQRALPSIPIDPKPLVPSTPTSVLMSRNQTSFSHVSPRIYLPTRPISRASPGRDSSRSTSPSITNLSQLSVVRQRLAQIETTSSKSSKGGLTTPVLSLRPELEPIHAMTRDGSRSTAADSIFDSYGDQSLELPELNLLPPLTSLPELETRNTSHPSVQFRSTKRQSFHTSRSATSSCFEPVTELLHDHSEMSCNQMSDLCEQVLSLRDDVQTLPRAIASTVDVEGHTNHVLKMVAKLEQQARLNGELLGSIRSKMDKRTGPETGAKDDDGVIKAIQTLRADVTKDLAHIRTVLEPKNETATLIEMKNVAPSSIPQSGRDISHLNSMTDGLLAAFAGKQVSATSVAQLEETLAKIGSSIEKDSGRQELQAQQQSETVRYLSELNLLCRDLNSTEGGSTLIADIRQLAQGTIARDHRFAALQASLDGLYTMLNENSMETSRNFALTALAHLATLVDGQRQHQEQLVRALGAEGKFSSLLEIFDEIRGERLRFVEAMKEATEINVQSKI